MNLAHMLMLQHRHLLNVVSTYRGTYAEHNVCTYVHIYICVHILYANIDKHIFICEEYLQNNTDIHKNIA